MFWVKGNFSRNPKNKQKPLPQSVAGIERASGSRRERVSFFFLLLHLLLFLLRNYESLIDTNKFTKVFADRAISAAAHTPSCEILKRLWHRDGHFCDHKISLLPWDKSELLPH
jgi:hypothetical protein